MAKPLPPAGNNKAQVPAAPPAVSNTPVAGGNPLPALLQQLGKPSARGQVPQVCWVYAVAAAVIFMFALYNLLQGGWFTALVLFVISATLVAFALFYLRHGRA